MRITLDWLRKQGACVAGMNAVAKRKGCLKPDTWYRLDSRGRFVVVKEGE